MSDQFVTIAAFDSPIEAHLVRGLLEGDGIRTMLGGENAASVFAGMSLAEITLQVHQNDLVRADVLLDDYEKNQDEPEPEEDDPEADGWACSICGDFVDTAATVCPSCQTPRDSIREDTGRDELRRRRRSGMMRLPRAPDHSVQKLDQTTTTPFPPRTGEDSDLDVPDMTTLYGDDLARRAFLAAVFSFIFFPLVFYSGWLLIKLMTYSGELSPTAQRKLYATLALDVIAGIVALNILGFFWR